MSYTQDVYSKTCRCSCQVSGIVVQFQLQLEHNDKFLVKLLNIKLSKSKFNSSQIEYIQTDG